MHRNKDILITTFALFSLFFGAGNLILPPLLGFKSGEWWWLVTLGFATSAVLIPILGILAHAKLQGTLFDFGKKVSPAFSLIYSLAIYAISISLPSPRTASVTHEIAVQPFFDIPSLGTSILYFSLVFVFVMNRSRILDVMGKILTPAIIIILLLIIGITLFELDFSFGTTDIVNPFSIGILEGYQTFDAIGAVVVGGVIIVSINLKSTASYEAKKILIRRSGWWAGLALFLIYAGLILAGALNRPHFEENIGHTALLTGISKLTLGNTANVFLSILVGLACFTTAVGIVAGTADFIKARYPRHKLAYPFTALVGSIIGVLMGQFDVAYILTVAVPALMFIYPITIVLILLNVVPDRLATPKVFKSVVITTVLFSIPDFLGSMEFFAIDGNIFNWIPLNQDQLGWVLPAVLAFIVTNASTSGSRLNSLQ